jgi:hypothetical protein
VEPVDESRERIVNMQNDDLIERLTMHYTSEGYKAEVAQARHQFFDEAGIIDEENIAFEMRVTQFLEWYLFTRPLDGKEMTPVKHALHGQEFKYEIAEQKAIENLAGARHSLFEFIKLRADDVHIKDLFTGKKIIIKDSPVRVGFSREELFDARLIPHEDTYAFTKAFCFHPEEATKFILGEVKKLKKAEQVLQEALMLRLLKMRYKYEQYRHLKLEHVYTNERKVKF